MFLNNTIFKLLELLTARFETVGLKINRDTIKLVSGEELLSLSKDSINVLNTVDFQKILLTGNSDYSTVNLANFSSFFDEIKNNFIRLNHLGIKYHVENLDEAKNFWKEIAFKSGVDIFEEQSGNEFEKWMFIGNKSDWKNPLFELVLTTELPGEDIWTPHFQIDIDTSLNADQIKKFASETLGNNFVNNIWSIDIPNYGAVLVMAPIGRVGKTQICLGVGTDKRQTRYHREQLLVPYRNVV